MQIFFQYFFLKLYFMYITHKPHVDIVKKNILHIMNIRNYIKKEIKKILDMFKKWFSLKFYCFFDYLLM